MQSVWNLCPLAKVAGVYLVHTFFMPIVWMVGFKTVRLARLAVPMLEHLMTFGSTSESSRTNNAEYQ